MRGPAVIAASSFFFALMAVATRTLAGKIPAAEISALRFAVGLLGAVILLVGRRRGPDLKPWRLLVLRGVLGGMAVVTYFYAIEHLGAAPATVLNYSSPVFASLFAFVFLKERSVPTARAGLALATLGAGLVAWSGGQGAGGGTHALGMVAGLVTPVLGGAAMTTIRRVRDDADSLSVFLAFCVFGLVVSLPLSTGGWVPVTWAAVPALLAVGLTGLFGQLLFTWGMGHTTATLGSATTQLVPVMAWILAIGWLHETVTPLAVLGALSCVGGVLLGVVPWRRAPGPAEAGSAELE